MRLIRSENSVKLLICSCSDYRTEFVSTWCFFGMYCDKSYVVCLPHIFYSISGICRYAGYSWMSLSLKGSLLVDGV